MAWARWTLAGAALVALLGGVWVVDALATRPIAVVRIAGDLSSAERQQVETVVGRELAGQPRRGVAAVAESIDAIGWVRTVRVRRQWPDVLRIAVQRETPAARWGNAAWLTASGTVVEDPGRNWQPPARLPAFAVAQADGRQAMRVFDIVNAAAADGGLTVAGLDQSPLGDWTATFAGDHDDGFTLMLGRHDLEARMQRFLHVYRQALRYADPIEHVDARYNGAVAVRPRTETEPLPRPPSNLLAAAVPSGVGD